MYFTLLNKFIELTIELGSKGFYLDLWLGGRCLFSIDSSFYEIAILIIATVIMKGVLCKLISRFTL